ncbi:kinesin-like protein KIF20A [Gadus morhua]|uniref:Kinesin-like protein n=1 Tax=Gadus morhua TaxID=8049 RepID=A0A8C4Z0A7_GADMO|nr:kinesin-like protein KIF20A [Gadus morhua]
MALYLASPCGLVSDEEGETPVFESTAAELGNVTRPRLPELSIISPGLETKASISAPKTAPAVERQGSRDDAIPEKVKVYVRVRPLSKEEKERAEEQGCVTIQNEDTLLLKAPKDSQAMKSAERGITQSIHKFSFSKIFGPETKQQELFEDTMKHMVKDVLLGENRLLYTYGVTNSGKTYTIQGKGREPGLLPRALASTFKKLQGRLYAGMDLKPAMYQDVRRLDPREVRAEEQLRDSLLQEDQSMNSRRGGTSTTWDSGIAGLSTSINTQLEDSDNMCLDPDSLSQSGGEGLEDGVQYSVWVSYYEIYNEFLYDLLEAAPTSMLKKRSNLKLSDDRQGNPYVKDLTWIQVRSAEEAWRVLRAGHRNQSFASTHLNENSSRSHSIFSMRLLHIHQGAEAGKAAHISELTVCDLAGSERCKDQRNGERMKEANNINTSLHTLGRCIAALRHNQNNRSRPPQVVPFRESKLTRVLQGYFSGRGSSSMVVNINPCAGVYDETLQALKFSAIATQLLHGPSTKSRVAYILSLLNEPAAAAAALDSTYEEEEDEEESDEEEGDMTMLNTESLLRAIEVLKRGVFRLRQEKETLEADVREQVVSETMEVFTSMQNDFSASMEAQRNLMEEKYETNIANLQKNLKRYYSQELDERDQEIAALTAALERKEDAAQPAPSTLPLPSSSEPPLPRTPVAGPRRSARQAAGGAAQQDHSRAELDHSRAELDQCRAELDQCRAELASRTQELRRAEVQMAVPGPTRALTGSADRKLEEGQRNLRQLRLSLQRLVGNLQSGERACCRNTDGERLRQGLSSADETLVRQDQILSELQNGLRLIKADLRRKDESLAALQASRPPPSGSAYMTTPTSCKKRGCGNTENHPPEKRTFFNSLFPARMATPKYGAAAQPNTPSARILRSRQQSPPPSPAPTPRSFRGKY